VDDEKRVDLLVRGRKSALCATSMEVPLIFSFWFMVAAYVVLVLDESLLGGSFVAKVREHWVAGIFLDQILLVQCWLLHTHDRKRGGLGSTGRIMTHLSTRVVDRTVFERTLAPLVGHSLSPVFPRSGDQRFNVDEKVKHLI
jgi:hypothetical protein